MNTLSDKSLTTPASSRNCRILSSSTDPEKKSTHIMSVTNSDARSNVIYTKLWGMWHYCIIDLL